MMGNAGYDDSWEPRHAPTISQKGKGVNGNVSP
jgi:hypothetical protein